MLDHVAKIAELDLDGVPPTSHVVERDRCAAARRAARVACRARSCSPRRRPSATRASSCRARRHERLADRLLELSARATRSTRSTAGALSAGELFEVYRERAAEHGGADGLNCFTWVAEDAPGDPSADAPLGGVPLAVKDLFCTKDVPSQSGSRILEGYLPPYHGDRRGAA